MIRLTITCILLFCSSVYAVSKEEWPVRYRLPTRGDIDKESFDDIDDDVFGHEGEQLDDAAERQDLTLKQEVTYYFGTFVSTSPYPGVRATYFGTELMSQLSNVNKDLQILIELESYKQFLEKRNLPTYPHPRMFLSGLVDAYAFYGNGATGSSESDIDLGGAEIGFLLTVNNWLNSIVILEYDNEQISVFGDRVNNSRIHVQNGIIMLGDLDASPFYCSLGQVYVPFGQYTTYASIQRPLTRLLFRTLAREVALGYYNGSLQGSVFAFKGGSFQDGGKNINNFGCNISYVLNGDNFQGKFGAGVIRNIADSQLQLVSFNPVISHPLVHVVPGAFINANISYKSLRFLGEYISATRPFALSDMGFSTDGGATFTGAHVSALDVELAYIFDIFGKESSLALGYSRSWEALGFALPKHRALLTSTTNVAKGALFSIELGYNRLYGENERASGRVLPGNPTYLNENNAGNNDFSIGLDFLIYW
jgi:hypothetical protein